MEGGGQLFGQLELAGGAFGDGGQVGDGDADLLGGGAEGAGEDLDLLGPFAESLFLAAGVVDDEGVEAGDGAGDDERGDRGKRGDAERRLGLPADEGGEAHQDDIGDDEGDGIEAGRFAGEIEIVHGGSGGPDMRRAGARNKGENQIGAPNGLRGARMPGRVWAVADFTGHFMRVEREAPDGVARHFVVHVRDPKFSVEMSPDVDAADKIGTGVIKKLSVPNSWAGNYNQYADLLRQAREFFRQSMLAEPASKAESHRLKF